MITTTSVQYIFFPYVSSSTPFAIWQHVKDVDCRLSICLLRPPSLHGRSSSWSVSITSLVRVSRAKLMLTGTIEGLQRDVAANANKGSGERRATSCVLCAVCCVLCRRSKYISLSPGVRHLVNLSTGKIQFKTIPFRCLKYENSQP